MSQLRHIIVVLLENEFGALSRVANLFSARGYNIESLNVAPTTDPTLSRMTIVSLGSSDILDQIIKQLNKLIDVVEAYAANEHRHYETEYVILRLRRDANSAAFIQGLSQNPRANIKTLEESERETMCAFSVPTPELEKYLEQLDPRDILEIARSGTLVLHRCQL